MVETLVAIVITAVGVMGAAGMQLTALRTARQSAHQTVAMHIATDIADAIRASQRWTSMSGRPNPYLEVNHDASHAGEGAPSAASCYADTCDHAEYAAFEIREWKSRIDQSLHGGQFVICRDSEPWDDGSHAVAWNCRGHGVGISPVVVKLRWRVTNTDVNQVADANRNEETIIAMIVSPGA